jgi:hypothetical protein
LDHKTPKQSLAEWQNKKPALFKINSSNQAGPDSQLLPAPAGSVYQARAQGQRLCALYG